MGRRKDIWRCGYVETSVEKIIAEGRISAPIRWLEEEPDFCFIADPFGWRAENGHLHLFVEHYDYRFRHGTIETLIFDPAMKLLERRPCLSEPWHLSYPQVFSGEGAVWMLPEAHRSGGLTLYRNDADLLHWKAECRIELDCVPVDATILQRNGRWWLFYSPAHTKLSKISHLHIASAERLTGPWTPHPGNPVRIDPKSSRPGGSAIEIGGRIMLPVQDCSRTYGGGVRTLWIDRLDEGHFHAEAGEELPIPPSAGKYSEGMHTLSACGNISFIDVKRIDRSLRGIALDVRRKLGGFSQR